MLGGTLVIGSVFAFLLYRIVTRIILPELKFRDDPLSDDACGDWPAIPTDLKSNHAIGSKR